jgi:hypothetical protein
MMEWQSGFLIDRANANCVLAFAITATPEKATVPLSRLEVSHLVDFHAAAMHTARIVAPTLRFKELDSHKFIGASGWNLLDNA